MAADCTALIYPEGSQTSNCRARVLSVTSSLAALLIKKKKKREKEVIGGNGWLVGCFNSECFSANEQSSVLGQINIARKSWAMFNVL